MRHAGIYKNAVYRGRAANGGELALQVGYGSVAPDAFAAPDDRWLLPVGEAIGLAQNTTVQALGLGS